MLLTAALLAAAFPAGAENERIAGCMQIQRVMRDGSLVCQTPYGETAHVTITEDTAIEYEPLTAGAIIEVTYADPIDDQNSTQRLTRFDVTATRIRGAVYEGIVDSIDTQNFSAMLSGPMISRLQVLLPKSQDSLQLDMATIRFVPQTVAGVPFTDAIEATRYEMIRTISGTIGAIDGTGMDLTPYAGRPLRVHFTGDTRIHRALQPGTTVSVYFVPDGADPATPHWVPDLEEITATSVWVAFG